MVTTVNLIESMKYKLTHLDGIPVVRLDVDPPQFLSLQDMKEWMNELRNEDTDLYANLLHPYLLLKRATEYEKNLSVPDNIVRLPAIVVQAR